MDHNTDQNMDAAKDERLHPESAALHIHEAGQQGDVKYGGFRVEHIGHEAAPDVFFEEVDFLSIGGNDLKQFFFAADRENERVRRRYDTLNVSFLTFIEGIVNRCGSTNTPLSFCGEDAGRPLEAVCLAAMGLRTLSMRPASIGPVKSILRRTNLAEVREIIVEARERGDQSVRDAVRDYLRTANARA